MSDAPRTIQRVSGRTKQCDTAIQIRIPSSFYKEIKERAKAETLPAATWIRMACRAQLRRSKLMD
jgi:predicted DNA binding CopG/RHH family protein